MYPSSCVQSAKHHKTLFDYPCYDGHNTYLVLKIHHTDQDEGSLESVFRACIL